MAVGFILLLTLWALLNGVDDCFIDIAAAIAWLRVRFHAADQPPTDLQLAAVPQRRMAILVPAWKEHRVIQEMLDNNAARLRYSRFDFFVGAYPNDGPTLSAIREAMRRHSNVHLAICPHDGPTSKADCLNWIYQRMIVHEEEHGVRFGMIVTHDAEDIIDPDALLWINYYAQWHDMVQIPVLALPTPLREITHGVYCDEFAEFGHRDMMARSLLGGFIPSNGVGTGYSRRALETLAAAHSGQIFEPGCLTEDYENGFRVAALGLSQNFVPIHIRHGRAIATREYFPRGCTAAVRQRSRWVTGITLQSWEYHRLRETLRHLYWFWRDRKSLLVNIAGPFSNMVFFYGAVALFWTRSWHLPAALELLLPGLIALQSTHIVMRVFFSARIYGFRFAAGVPIRIVAGIWINGFATCQAIAGYLTAKWQGRPLRWTKTDHAYPSRAALITNRKRLGEVLAGGQWISRAELDAALASQPATRRLGEHLLELGLITEANLYTALSLQNNLPLGKPEAALVSVPVTRSLPAAVAKKWHVLPFRIAAGELYVAGSEIPGDEMQKAIRQFSSLEIRFQLVTPSEYEELAARYLS